MSEAITDAVAVLHDLLKSDSETVRLQAAAAILQFACQAKSDTSMTDGETSQTAVLDVVRANRFELVSTDGKVLAVLGKVKKHPFDSEVVGDGIGLALLDNDGRPQVRLCADNHDGLITSQGLTIYDISGKYRVNVGASAGGGGLGMKQGTNSKFEMFIAAHSPILRFTDKDEKQRVFVGLDTFQLAAADGSVLFNAP
ncbi:MAG: hypothetical protein WD049_01925 [Candidatus Paceibacterota bacterium]